MTPRRPSALIVVESYWGNTAAIAAAVADGLRQAGVEPTLVDAADAPVSIGPETGLLLIGAPTHNMALPGPSSRRTAATRGAPADGPGVREWLERLRFEAAAVVYAFDTHTSKYSGSAAEDAVRRLRRSPARAQVGERFQIAGDPPVLREGELARAAAWGRQLAAGIGADVPSSLE
ncbi:MAG: flavodoxin domain-containing protein [Propionicimonas sp.]|nr:flavodoxin/nitric oxide synthase [Propionicimonas sp.]